MPSKDLTISVEVVDSASGDTLTTLSDTVTVDAEVSVDNITIS